MPSIRVKHVLSFSSQDPKHTVEDLVRGRGSWLGNVGDKTGRLQADLQLGWATTISYIDVGNAGSVMVSVEVGRSSWPTTQPLVTLLPAASLVSPEEWRAGKNRNTVRMFKSVDLDSEARDEKWDKVRIVCLQPFRKDGQFGLSLFRLYTNTEVSKEDSSNVVMDFVEDTSRSNSKKEELVARMNLPFHKKNTISQRIGWLENHMLSQSDDPATPAAPNPITSPVSRAARLLSMATPTTSKEPVDTQKQELECEALDFLISLHLTIADIYSLKVIGVRQDFEKKRKKELEHSERVIFKEIALDFAKRRLNILEREEERDRKLAGQCGKQQSGGPRVKPTKRKNEESHFSSGDDFDNFEAAKKASSASRTPKRSIGKASPNAAGVKTPQSSQTRRKFTFRRTSSLTATTPDQLGRTGKSPGRVSERRLKLRQDDDLSEPLSSSTRNNIALGDSKVVTPSRKARDVMKERKGGTPQSAGKNKTPPSPQSNLDVWITSNAKRKKENKPFTFSRKPEREFSTVVRDSSSDDELIVVIDDDRDPAPSSLSDSRGGFLKDILQTTKPKDTKIRLGSDGGTSHTTTHTSGQPAGGDSGHLLNAVPVDKYGITNRRASRQEQQCDSDSDSTSSHGGGQHTDTMVECPLCLGFFHSSQVESHAASCGTGTTMLADSGGKNGAEAEGTVDKATECPLCGKIVMMSGLEDHGIDCASTMFD